MGIILHVPDYEIILSALKKKIEHICKRKNIKNKI